MSNEETAGASPLDRALQRELLLAMRAEWPRPVEYHPQSRTEELVANVFYLDAHGLCTATKVQPLAAPWWVISAAITARGLDFLEDDGGLSAILGVVTVRLHADTIRDLIAAKIETMPISAGEKSALRRHLAALSETGLRAATTDLVTTGLDHLPDATQWLGRLLGL